MEMNLHMPQDVDAEAELLNLAAVPYQIISPGNNKPIIGIFQDSMLGSFRFSRENIHFTVKQAMNLLMMFQKVDESLFKDKKTITNFEVLSQILPPLSLHYKNKLFGDKDDAKTSNNVLEIKNGTYIRGQMDKGVLGDGSKGIIHRICNDYGNMASANFIDDLQNIITEYMKSSAYSVGISDLISDDKTKQDIGKIITEKKSGVKNLIDQTQMGVFENNTGKTNQEEFETQVNNILNQASSEAGKIGLKSLSKDNRFVIMVNAGSKGSDLNITQMISCLGQQNVDGRRIPYGFDRRTLPHYTKFDDSPSARGFVESSYINGLNPQELFFHAMAGRIGLIDTAVKSVTWETPIVIIENQRAKYTEIGLWIDTQLDNVENVSKIQHFTARQMELMNIKEGDVYIPTTDENGVVTWGEVTAITRHDPGTELYEIKTAGGRNVIVTESKSLLIWNPETKKLKETPTPEIVVGDCVPVTRELCRPPIVVHSVDMTKYLPKGEFVYGSDFNKAVNMMIEKMNENKKRQRIPAGWWNENNGKHFTLPYSKKSSLQRTCVRSNVENIKDGCIYPYSGSRKETRIPAQFELNEENGIFIGLFLAEGNVYNKTICITNNNENIRSFVKKWFDSYSIEWTERSRTTSIGSTTTTIVGNSIVLATFLNKFVGHGAEHKHVPTESFISNEWFIVGLLNGYFSGDGTVSKNSVEVGSASSRLIEGISMLCSRFGIFGKVFKTQLKSNNFGTKNIKPTHRFAIRAQWGKIFAEKIHLLEEKKQERLRNIRWGKSHRNFETYNDVVLDKIVEINIIGVEKHPKVYDLTIPSTLNFGIANGMQVRDTSTTGYIQRRLIKGLEDLMVNYDMTVRNNKGKIVEFAYGDDNIDPVKVENQPIPLVTMSIQEIYSHFNIPEETGKMKTLGEFFLKNTMTRFKKQNKDIQTKCKSYTDFMIVSRDEIIKNIFKYKGDSMVSSPVAFALIISSVQGQMNLNPNSIVDITPLEAFEMIEATFANLEKIRCAPPTALFKVLYYFNLSPKELLIVKRFNKAALTLLLETIVVNYKRAIVAPGEMVGMIAAQSIGEPSTQMTLNSFVYETEMLVRNREGQIQKVQIGDFVEKYIKNNKKLEYYEKRDTTYAELGDYYEIPSCTEDGEILWKEIEAVTRHPVINEDGTNTMLHVTTDEEREVVATKAKSFLKLIDGKIIPVNGSSLKVGDYLPVSIKQIDFQENFVLKLKEILPPTEYIYGSEFEKARVAMKDGGHWWKKHSGKAFVLPYSRSDSFVFKASDKVRGSYKTTFQENCVYMKKNNACDYTIPEELPLNYNLGYLVGAYAAEGCMTAHQISISNNDSSYFEPIMELCKQLNVTTKVYRRENVIQEGWTTQDVRIYSTVLCRILEKLCGKLSHNKFVSDRIVFSNKECLLGFLDAYIGGDGCIEKKGKVINMCSVSKKMLIDIQQIFNNLGFYSYIKKTTKPETNNRGSKDIKQPYYLKVAGSQLQTLSKLLNIRIGYKQELLQSLENHAYQSTIGAKHLKIPNEINGEIVIQKRGKNMENIVFNKIKSIIEVPNTTNYAFDLTVKDTRNFNIYNGLAIVDTFHHTGISSKSNVTRGVPRLEEILSLSSEPKNPSLTVFMKPEEQTDREKAQSIMYMLEHTNMEEIVRSTEICFDPDDLNSLIEEDKNTIEQYRSFENMMNECNEVSLTDDTNEKSKWILRMEMDPEIMLEKNITMDDVHFTLKNSFGDEISCIYSDYNADKLIFRIRMNSVLKPSTTGPKKIKVNPLDQSDQIYLLKNFQDQILNNIVIRGVKKINKVILRKIKDTVIEDAGVYKKQDIWVLDTVGSNLLDVLALDYIDSTRTLTNDIVETYNIFGIEAARQTIYNELVEVIEFDGTYVNFHHMCMLCDRMTYANKMISIFRHGINNDNIGPIAKASFEETPEMFLKAARHAELDIMRGVSANIMCGQEGLYGTNLFQVVLDLDEMRKLNDVIVEETMAEEDAIEKIFGDFENHDDKCSTQNLTIENNVDTIQTADLGQDDDYEPGF
jgi:DNA-directed RNA polymerase beta' subunit